MDECLVVFYSRSGTTRAAAEAISEALRCDLEEIVERRSRTGILGYVRSSLEATLGRRAPIAPRLHDPSEYDLVAVGTPVWNGSVSSPVRTYLSQHRGRLRNVAFFCTEGGRWGRRAFRQMSDLCGKAPVAVLELKAGLVVERAHLPLARRFAQRLREALSATTGGALEVEPPAR